MPNKLRFLTQTLATPIGELVLISDEDGRLRATDWTNYDERMVGPKAKQTFQAIKRKARRKEISAAPSASKSL